MGVFPRSRMVSRICTLQQLRCKKVPIIYVQWTERVRVSKEDAVRKSAQKPRFPWKRQHFSHLVACRRIRIQLVGMVLEGFVEIPTFFYLHEESRAKIFRQERGKFFLLELQVYDLIASLAGIIRNICWRRMLQRVVR